MLRRRAMPTRRIRVVAILASMSAGAAVLAFACGPGSIGDLTSGRRDASPVPTPTVVDLCPGRALAPPPPNVPDSVTLDSDLVFAADDMRVDTGAFTTDLEVPLGLDLDHTCTCIEEPSCLLPPDASARPCSDAGRDNITGPILGDLATFLPSLEPGFIRRRIRDGVYTLLFAVQHWNGTKNDPKVLVNFFMSPGMDRSPDGGYVYPQFKGTDVWSVDQGSLVNGKDFEGKSCQGAPCVGSTDTGAYITDGVLVAHFAAIPLSLNLGSGQLVLPFSGAILTAQITGERGLYRMHGQLTGRMPVDELLKAASALREPVSGKSLCANAQSFSVFKQTLCGSADLLADPKLDHTKTTCNALSEAVTFSSVQAKVGIVRAVVQEPSDCPSFEPRCAD